MYAGIWLKLLHVFTAFALIAGVVGRGVTFSQARASDDVDAVHALLGASDLFEKRLVIPFSAFVVIFGIATAWVQGWPILGFLQRGAVNWVLVSLVLTLTLIPLVIFVLQPRATRRRKALAEALREGKVTTELRASLDDRGVAWGRVYEITLLALITALMVLKPF